MYVGTSRAGNRLPAHNPIVTAGLIWHPEIDPIVKAIVSSVKPNASYHHAGTTLVAEIGYAGTHGVHTMMNVNINGSAPNTGNAGRQLFPYVTSDLNSITPFGSMTYHGLQSRLRKRIGSGNSFGQGSDACGETGGLVEEAAAGGGIRVHG